MKFREFLKWLIYGTPSKGEFMRERYEKRDRENKKNKEVWHYTCENGHKWKSYSSPTGSFCADNYGMKETACPTCRSKICMGNVYKNGKLTGVGACHMGFRK